MEDIKEALGIIKNKNSKVDKEPHISIKEVNQNIIENIVINFDSNSLIQGFVMAEIIGRPKAKVWRGNTIWNSRF